MPVLDTRLDTDDLTLTVVTEIDATPERAWQLWADHRQLEQWWGPPTWPATFHRHELEPGGESRYFMTGPDGSKGHGWFSIVETDAPNRLVFKDGFAGEDGEPTDPEDYGTVTVTIEPAGERTRMSVQTRFRSAEQLKAMTEMGMAEGMTEAMGQIDALVAA
ncbi:SRPBCC family protein [Pseudactinotalea suaedae]|uniref:SRPBCC family protein n=1 Tax=Pseudactinotalea suaedae TaxID=1524924 RepID=UPI0012E126DA|nr:SRPBCC domain-containing protein [Pseudactinotalea suaedae]